MKTEKQMERLVELIQEGKSHAFCDICEGRSDCENCENERIADFLLENRVIVDTGEETKKRLWELFNFAKSINSERVELQKDEYLYLIEYMEKAEKVIKERKENDK